MHTRISDVPADKQDTQLFNLQQNFFFLIAISQLIIGQTSTPMAYTHFTTFTKQRRSGNHDTAAMAVLTLLLSLKTVITPSTSVVEVDA